VIEANLTAATMLGVGRDSLLHSRFSDFLAPASQDAAYLYWQKVFCTAGKQLTELELLRPDGESATARLESIAFDSPYPPSRQCLVALIDTTDLKFVRDSLVALNENLEDRVDAQVQEIKLMASALANLSEGVLITADHHDWPGSRVVFVNHAMCKFVGYTLEELRDQMPGQLLERLIGSAAIGRITDQIAATGQFYGELEYTCTDGECGEIELSVSPMAGADSTSAYFVAVQRDITRRKRDENVLRERKERLQAIQDAAFDAIITIDQKGIIQDCNPAVEQVFGYAAAEILGGNISLLMPEPYRKEHDGYLRRYLETGEAHIIGKSRDLIALHRDGHSFPITLSVSEIDHLGLYTGVISDNSHLRKLQREVLLAAGKVQWRIGQALHDGPQQTLAGLSLVARGLAMDLDRQGSSHAAKVSGLSERLNQANKAIRLLGRGLIPVQVGSSGLVTALQNLARQISEEYDLSCDLQCPEADVIKDDYTVDQLYHIAQEAVLNAANHSGADHIGVFLQLQGHNISLRVVDNGSGIKKARAGRQGLGMQIMRYRAATIGASLTVSDAAGGGTVVTCTLNNFDAVTRE
jgi:PAS domain S-box-containing protein